MAIDIDLIEKLMRLMEASAVQELELSEAGSRIRLSKAATPLSGAAAPAQTFQPPQPVAQTAVAAVPAAAPAPVASAAPSGPEHIVRAGLSGTFYRAPMPGEAPYVEVGSRIAEGGKLAIIEAMKMMNPVEAEVDGIVSRIHVEDGAPVEPGTVLFTLSLSA